MSRRTMAIFFSGVLLGTGITLTCFMPYHKRRLAAVKALREHIPFLNAQASWPVNGLFILDGQRYTFSDLSSAEQEQIRASQTTAYSQTLQILEHAALTQARIMQPDTNSTVNRSQSIVIHELKDSGRLQFLVRKPFLGSLNLSQFPNEKSANAQAQLVLIADPTEQSGRLWLNAIDEIRAHHGRALEYVEIVFPQSTNRLAELVAIGARCAFNQGNSAYFAFRKAARSLELSTIASVAENPESASAHLFGLAKLAELNITAFTRCINSPEAHSLVSNTTSFIASSLNKNQPNVLLNGEIVAAEPDSLSTSVAEALNAR